MKTLLFLIAASTACTPAFAASYEQGVCDGIRATQMHAPTVNIGIIADGGKQRYFRCNGTDPSGRTGAEVFVRAIGWAAR